MGYQDYEGWGNSEWIPSLVEGGREAASGVSFMSNGDPGVVDCHFEDGGSTLLRGLLPDPDMNEPEDGLGRGG